MKKLEMLEKVKALDGLSAEEKSYLINLVSTKKKYGLVWEDKPEEVEEELRTKLPVLKEVKVRAIINDTEDEQYPNHILIEGDNLHALTALTFTHEGQIDTMFFDPPYNTGNKSWRYNNDYVEKDDSFRHSKWLSFMAKRLKIAKQLLSRDGILVISIDDYELSPLILLLDELFGENNRIGIAIIENNPRGRTTNKFFATCHEYYLVYAKNSELASINPIPLNEEQRNLFKFKDTSGSYRLLPFRRSGGLSSPKERPNSEFPLYYCMDRNRIIATGGPRLHDYNTEYSTDTIYYCDDEGIVDIISTEQFFNKVLNYIEIFPVDVKGNRRVWRWSDREKILHHSYDGDFVCSERSSVWTVYLKDRIKDGRKAKTIWSDPKYDASSNGTVLIDTILDKRNVFDYPKSIFAVQDFLNVIENKDKKETFFLDAFAGSGTTLHAVLKLNVDSIKRKCILITNNENKIAEEVCYERNKRVISGYIKNNQFVNGYSKNNLRYFRCNFAKREPSLANKRELTLLATELLCIKEETYLEYTYKAISVKQEWISFFTNKAGKYLCIIYDDLKIEEGVVAIQKLIDNKQLSEKIKVYVFSNGQYPYTEDFEEVLEHITLSALPDAIYKAYQNVLPKQQKLFIPELEEPTAKESEEVLESGEMDLFNQPE